MKSRQLGPRVLLYATALFLMAGGAWHWRGDFVSAIDRVGASEALLLAALVLLQWVARGVRDSFFLRTQWHRVPFFSLLRINAVQTGLNYLPLKAGTVSSAWMFKDRHQVPLIDFGVQVFLQSFVTFLVSFSGLLVSAALSRTGNGTFVWAILGLIGIWIAPWWLMAKGSGILRWGLARAPENFPRAGWKDRASALLDRFSHSRMVTPEFFAGIAAAFAVVAVNGVRLMELYRHAGGVELGLSQAILLTAALQVAPLLSFTPAGLGVNELILMAASGGAGLPPASGLVVSIVDRAVILACSIGVGVVGGILGNRTADATTKRTVLKESVERGAT